MVREILGGCGKNSLKSLTNDLLDYIILALMQNSLPSFVNPWLLFRHHETVSGCLDLATMPYLQQSQNRQTGYATVTLAVDKREDGHCVLVGSAKAELELECQCCLEPIVSEFVADFELVLVKFKQQLKTVSDEDDAIVVEEQLELAPLIEQELLLALPMIAKHDNCRLPYENTASETVDTQQPFAHLKDLLN